MHPGMNCADASNLVQTRGGGKAGRVSLEGCTPANLPVNPCKWGAARCKICKKINAKPGNLPKRTGTQERHNRCLNRTDQEIAVGVHSSIVARVEQSARGSAARCETREVSPGFRAHARGASGDRDWLRAQSGLRCSAMQKARRDLRPGYLRNSIRLCFMTRLT
jgi:hypothetical protein